MLQDPENLGFKKTQFYSSGISSPDFLAAMMLKDRAGYELMKEKEMEDRARVEEEEERLGKWK